MEDSLITMVLLIISMIVLILVLENKLKWRHYFLSLTVQVIWMAIVIAKYLAVLNH